MPARRAVMWRLCRHKRGRPRSYRRTCSSTKRHVLRHRAWNRLVLCRSRIWQESLPTRAICGLARTFQDGPVVNKNDNVIVSANMTSENTTNGSVGPVRTQIVNIALPPAGFQLECGQVLPELQIAYETYGVLAAKKDNVVFLCHALSGNAHVAGYHEPPDDTMPWWDNMVGPGKGIDTRFYFVVCALSLIHI